MHGKYSAVFLLPVMAFVVGPQLIPDAKDFLMLLQPQVRACKAEIRDQITQQSLPRESTFREAAKIRYRNYDLLKISRLDHYENSVGGYAVSSEVVVEGDAEFVDGQRPVFPGNTPFYELSDFKAYCIFNSSQSKRPAHLIFELAKNE